MTDENKEVEHFPVLVKEVLEYLKPEKGKPSILVDSTLGAGGHSEAFLNEYPDLTVYGVEADEGMVEIAGKRLAKYKKRFQLFNSWFSDFYSFYDRYSRVKPDRILFDLGISIFHYKIGKRGFSFTTDEELDMRLNKSLKISAYDIVNKYPEEDISNILFKFGEERFSRRIARNIVKARKQNAIKTTFQLVEIILRSVPRKPAPRKGSQKRHVRIHPATKSFQALRIAVNDELKQLEDGLAAAFEVLKEGGRIGVISFHSLEDRIVKHFFKKMNKVCTCPPEWPICQCLGKRRLKIITKKVVRPGRDEVWVNPASRSSKLRVAEKLIY